MLTEFEKSIGFIEHVDCCANCKHGHTYIAIGGYEETECKKFEIDVFNDSVCKYYQDA